MAPTPAQDELASSRVQLSWKGSAMELFSGGGFKASRSPRQEHLAGGSATLTRLRPPLLHQSSRTVGCIYDTREYHSISSQTKGHRQKRRPEINALVGPLYASADQGGKEVGSTGKMRWPICHNERNIPYNWISDLFKIPTYL